MPNTFLGFPVTRAKFADAVLNMSGVVGRGPAAGPDWAVGDLDPDGAEHDLDCSAIVPAGAKWILLFVTLQCTTDPGAFAAWKKSDGALGIGDATQAGQTSDLAAGTLFVPCDTDRVLSYFATAGTYPMLSVSITGWIL